MFFVGDLAGVNDIKYETKVLYPIAMEWLVIILCNVNAPEARYYLKKGGSYAGKAAYGNLLRKMNAKTKTNKK